MKRAGWQACLLHNACMHALTGSNPPSHGCGTAAGSIRHESWQLPAPGTGSSHDAPSTLLPPLQDCNAAAGSTDYEFWQLPSPGACLLGAKYTMQRRKRDAGCFNTGACAAQQSL